MTLYGILATFSPKQSVNHLENLDIGLTKLERYVPYIVLRSLFMMECSS